jgi:hypothetical protein
LSATLQPYAAIVAIAREELELVAAGRFDELSELNRRRTDAMAQLPAVDPPAAAPLLREALGLQEQVSEALAVARAGALSALDHLHTGRTTVAGYQASTGAQAPAAQADYRG